MLSCEFYRTPYSGLTPAPHSPRAQVEDLGKSVIQGHEVEGKRFLMQPPPPAQIPAMPKTPALTAAGLPKTPQAAKAGAASTFAGGCGATTRRVPTTAEVWTSTSMRLPKPTKMSGGFGQLTQVSQGAVPAEPHTAAFQIPADYKVVHSLAKPPHP